MQEENFVPAEASVDVEGEKSPRVVHRLVTPTLCSCGEMLPETDTVCPRCGTDHGLERHVDEFIRQRMM